MAKESQLVREVQDTLQQLIMLVKSGASIRCRFCHELIGFEGGLDGLTIICKHSAEDGVYHMRCHERAFPEKHGLKGDLNGRK